MRKYNRNRSYSKLHENKIIPKVIWITDNILRNLKFYWENYMDFQHSIFLDGITWTTQINSSKSNQYTYIISAPHYTCMCSTCVSSYVWLFVTPWTVACQVSLSMEFFRQAYCSGLPFPSSGSLPDRSKNQTCVSCTDRKILYCWATWKDL